MSERTLTVHYQDEGDVDVQGYLKFTKAELEEISDAILIVASRRPSHYSPQPKKPECNYCGNPTCIHCAHLDFGISDHNLR